MYLPPLNVILGAVGSNSKDFERGADVAMPADLLKTLLQTALAACEFDEASYLAANPDVAEGVKSGAVQSARVHFIGYGYFEGRRGALPKVDERWYLSTYQDVFAALQQGTAQVVTAAEHFEEIGVAEGRSPTARHVQVSEQWKKALNLK